MKRIIAILKQRAGARRQGQGHIRRGIIGQAGMTLLEIMIVLALLGLVTGAIVAGVIPAFKRGKIKTAKTAIVQIAGVVAQYSTDNDGKCPSIDDLVASGFLPKGQAKDPWGTNYIIKDCEGAEGAHVVSLGPDKQEATADDVKSSE
jgi:general secretion pathway protein G